MVFYGILWYFMVFYGLLWSLIWSNMVFNMVFYSKKIEIKYLKYVYLTFQVYIYFCYYDTSLLFSIICQN